VPDLDFWIFEEIESKNPKNPSPAPAMRVWSDDGAVLIFAGIPVEASDSSIVDRRWRHGHTGGQLGVLFSSSAHSDPRRASAS
jgi:hypothetical protein